MDCYFREPVKHELIQGHLKMGGVNAAGEKIGANSLFFTRDGVPWIGTMGEYHFCRDERENWRTELLKMKAGGISVVSTYVFWIYHEEDEGVFDFPETGISGASCCAHGKRVWKYACVPAPG